MKQRIYSMDQLETDICVEVEDKSAATKRKGVVTKIHLCKRCKMVDGRPVSSIRVVQAIISYKDGDETVITKDNFKQFKVNVIL